VSVRVLLLYFLLRSSWRTLEGGRQIGAAGVLHCWGGRVAVGRGSRVCLFAFPRAVAAERRLPVAALLRAQPTRPSVLPQPKSSLALGAVDAEFLWH
jgi:hypothetical protein